MIRTSDDFGKLVNTMSLIVRQIALSLGSWAEQNVDPSLFSKELMAHASSLLGDEEVDLFQRKKKIRLLAYRLINMLLISLVVVL